MPSMSNLKTESIYALFKGEPGTRKSTAALSFPGPQYWFSYDQKMNALRIPMKKWNIDPSSIEFDDFTDYMKAEQKLRTLQTNCKYKTIIIDSITSAADAINRQTKTLKSGTTGKDGGEKGIRIGGIAVNSLEDFNAEDAAFKEIIALTKDIKSFHNCNVILIGHVIGDRSIKENPGGLTALARILVTGGKKISAKFPAYADEVYHFEMIAAMDSTKAPDYGFWTIHSGGDFARTALPLEQLIKFNDKPIWKEWIKPAIDLLNG